MFYTNLPPGYTGSGKNICLVFFLNIRHLLGGGGRDAETLEKSQYYCCAVTCLQYPAIRQKFITICVWHVATVVLSDRKSRVTIQEHSVKPSPIFPRTKTEQIQALVSFNADIKERCRHESQATRGKNS